MSKIRTYTKVYPLGHKRKLTLACSVETGGYEGDYKHYGILKIAMAIRNPIDEYDAEMGKTIALNRLNHEEKDFVIYTLELDTFRKDLFLRADTVYAHMDMCADWVKRDQELFF